MACGGRFSTHDECDSSWRWQPDSSVSTSGFLWILLYDTVDTKDAAGIAPVGSFAA